MRLGHRFRRNAILAIGGGVLLLFLGIALPRDRRQALLLGGAALATVALVLFFLPPLARTAITVSMRRAELRPVVAGVFDAFAGGLRTWALLLAGMGIVLASAASSFASHVEIEEIATARLAAAAEAGQELRRRAAARGAAARVRPAGRAASDRHAADAHGDRGRDPRLRGAARAVHARAAARAARAARQAEAAVDEARDRIDDWQGARTLGRYALVGAITLGLIGAGVAFMGSREALPPAPAFTDACNGDRALCGKRVDEVVFPGAHNSMSSAELGWMFPNQELASVSLLGYGIRSLLFDVHYGAPVGDQVRTEIQDEVASRAKFEQAIGKEAIDAAMRIRSQLQGAATGPRARLPVPRLLRARGDAARADARGRARLPGGPPRRGAGVRDRGLRHAGRHRGRVPGERARALRLPRAGDARRGRRSASSSRATSACWCSARTTPRACRGTTRRSRPSRRRPTSS